jgi:threonine/homoserine/homoserine lactone efflux protein
MLGINRYVDIMTTTAQLPYLAIFLSSFTVALSGCLMPGPLLTTTITESLRRGFITAPLLMVGHAILEMALIYAILLGLSPLLNNQWLFISVSLAGGAILLGMAWSLWQSLPTLKFAEASVEIIEERNLVLKGITITVSNPYFSIWWVTIGLGYIMQSLRFGMAGIACFFAGHILADCLWYGTVAFAVAKGRRFLSPRMYRMLMSIGAALLAFFACYFFYSGVNGLLLLGGHLKVVK